MEKIHQKLSQNVSAYQRWHSTPYASIVHLCLLIIFSTLFAQSIVSALNGVPRSSLTAAALRDINGRPDKSGRVIGFAEDRILVKFNKTVGSAKKSEILSARNLTVKSTIPQIGVDILLVDPNDTAEEAVQNLRFKHSKEIEFAEVDYLLEPAIIPNDPSFSSQWNKAIVNAPAAWDITTGSTAVVVGIADTGVDCTHADLSANCVAGWNFYDNNADSSDVYGHGTAVAGVVAAVGNNGVGISGTGWNVKIMPLRISLPDGSAYMSTVSQAIVYAADRGVKVVNNSYTGSSASLQSAAQYLSSKTGGVLVKSMGNTGADSGETSNNPDVIRVGATDGNDNKYSWSTYGQEVDVVAPGCATTTARGGGYRSFCGTSSSAPEVAGLLALMYSVNPNLDAQGAYSALFSTVKDLGASGWDIYYGWGRIQADKAVLAAKGGSTVTPTPAPTPTPTVDSTPPAVPQNLTAVAQSSVSIKSSWSSSTDNVGVTGYDLYRNGTKIWNGSTTYYTDDGASPDSTYSYAVLARDAAGNISTLSSPVSVSTPSAQLQVDSFSVVRKTGTTAIISWTTNTPSNGQVIYGTQQNNLSMKVAATDPNGTSHSVDLSGLNKKTTYYYAIQATQGSETVTSGTSSFRTTNR